jgi:pSer/pThr/pTyr-binding forkhead associated (FHA) protein
MNSTVSRKHAILRHEEGKWWLRDLGSMNGTFLNGWRVVGDVEVRAGDRVSLGEVEYRLTHTASLSQRGDRRVLSTR